MKWEYLIAVLCAVIPLMFANQLQNLGNRVLSRSKKIGIILIIIVVLCGQFLLPGYIIYEAYHAEPFDKDYIRKVGVQVALILIAYTSDFVIAILYLLRKSEKRFAERFARLEMLIEAQELNLNSILHIKKVEAIGNENISDAEKLKKLIALIAENKKGGTTPSTSP
jgi:hypothetical protein